MTILHTVNKSPFERKSLTVCIDHLSEGSAVLLIEDAVYGAVAGEAASRLISVQGVKVYVLGPDLAARGIPEDQVPDGVGVVDYEGFVDLAVEHDAVHAWL